MAYSATIAANLSVTVTLNSGVGAPFDCRLATIDMLLGARWAYWVNDSPWPMAEDDTIDVVVPADANGTSSVVIYLDSDEPLPDGEGGYQVERGGQGV